MQKGSPEAQAKAKAQPQAPAPTPAPTPDRRADGASIALWTRRNGEPARLLRVDTSGQPQRPAPGHFGSREPAEPEQVRRPLYPTLPDFG